MNMTPKQRKSLFIVGGILATLYLGPRLMLTVREAMLYRWQQARSAHAAQTAPRRALKPAPGNTVPSPAPDADAAALGGMLGHWQGSGAPVAGGGICTMKLEIQENASKDTYSGYSELRCMPSVAQLDDARAKGDQANILADLQKAQTPQSAILTGTAKHGTLSFHVTQNLGSGCDLTVLPFGTNHIAVAFRESPSCAGGHMELRKAGR